MALTRPHVANRPHGTEKRPGPEFRGEFFARPRPGAAGPFVNFPIMGPELLVDLAVVAIVGVLRGPRVEVATGAGAARTAHGVMAKYPIHAHASELSLLNATFPRLLREATRRTDDSIQPTPHPGFDQLLWLLAKRIL